MGTLERRQREKKERRAQILRAARTMFWKDGYEGTTMPRIAEAAELAPGTLYLYFPSKESLYAQLLVEGYDLLIARMKKSIARRSAPEARAEALIDAFFGFARENPEYFDVIFFVVQRHGEKVHDMVPDNVQAALLVDRQKACKTIAAEVMQGADPNASPQEIAVRVDAIWSMLGGVVLYFLKDGPESFARVSAAARDLLLRAVFAQHPRPIKEVRRDDE